MRKKAALPLLVLSVFTYLRFGVVSASACVHSSISFSSTAVSATAESSRHRLDSAVSETKTGRRPVHSKVKPVLLCGLQASPVPLAVVRRVVCPRQTSFTRPTDLSRALRAPPVPTL
ncbi:MAG TPA: hypothetical protein VL404_06730 [Candidatus Eisenbacteria bacterium]|nr:hypothetical protein [Candidatus Eisenbacteria bacterium]